jgi:hypothetical protein
MACRLVLWDRFRDSTIAPKRPQIGCRPDSFFGSVWDTVQIASDGRKRVLVTWAVRRGIEERWARVRGM